MADVINIFFKFKNFVLKIFTRTRILVTGIILTMRYKAKEVKESNENRSFLHKNRHRCKVLLS